jgi:hypothetical protein
MTSKNATFFRTNLINELFDYFSAKGEDCGAITSGSFNFPVVGSDGEEGWIEIVVKVPKGTKTAEYDGYGLREDYEIKLKNAAERTAKSKAKAEAAQAKRAAKNAE